MIVFSVQCDEGPALAVTGAKAELRVRFNPRVVTAFTLIRLVEARTAPASQCGDRTSARAGEFRARKRFSRRRGNRRVCSADCDAGHRRNACPLKPGDLRDTAHQAREGKFGLPLLYTSIVGVTLATRQFLSAALMFWCFRYWEHRYR